VEVGQPSCVREEPCSQCGLRLCQVMEAHPGRQIPGDPETSGSPLLPLECLEAILWRCSPGDICRGRRRQQGLARRAQGRGHVGATPASSCIPSPAPLPELAACDSPLRALSLLHSGIPLPRKRGHPASGHE